MRRTIRKSTKFVLFCVPLLTVFWLICIGSWKEVPGPRISRHSTIRTIVAYSEGKMAEMEKPYPVTCDRMPTSPVVKEYDHTWQPGVEPGTPSWQRVPGTDVLLYNAYYDDRRSQHYIRILASFPGRVYPVEEMLYCQTRPQRAEVTPNEATLEVVAAKPLEIWHQAWDRSNKTVRTSLLLSCPLTEPLTQPSIVSIVTQTCEDPSNAFLIKPLKQILKRNFTVCVKDLHFKNDISTRLIEWVEINKIVGVDKIDVYIDTIHKNTENVLLYYAKVGYIRMFRVPVEHNPDLWQRRRDHIVTFNDCLYRNIKETEFIIPLDVDEVIVPKIADNLQRLIQRLRDLKWDSNQSSAAVIRNVFFFENMQKKLNLCNAGKNDVYTKRDDVRLDKETQYSIGINSIVDKNVYNINICRVNVEDLRVMKHNMRSALISPEGAYSKSIMVTRNVLTAFNHYPLESVETKNTRWFAPLREVQLNHYKDSCNATTVPECIVYEKQTKIDCTIAKFKEDLKKALALVPCLT